MRFCSPCEPNIAVDFRDDGVILWGDVRKRNHTVEATCVMVLALHAESRNDVTGRMSDRPQ
jgi:hypothetical protein